MPVGQIRFDFFECYRVRESIPTIFIDPLEDEGGLLGSQELVLVGEWRNKKPSSDSQE